MADDYIGVSFATLQEAAVELEDILKQLNQRLETLYGRTEKVVLTWKGDTRDALVEELDQWDKQMQDLQAAQAWLHEIITTGHANYSAAHLAVLRGWGGA
ncbi:WXG100 family type VII secretion target [Streptomyces albipurpureus]|uniref:WXG100 family type VII secretion target n=1 Tax=Streptomyces albipurpureus TaxID=2897419 RepID=A0ABT0UUE1_9ACTN|nr:WXG100 family type VII secretion target [Streptomyces sp. CWNU-1]MCM2391240.1 WXG100 family type VII secretion target [Streptomyces sp. CWNU-1]